MWIRETDKGEAMNNLNSDRYLVTGIFPSSVYVKIKQETKRTGGSSTLWNGANPEIGFMVGDGKEGLIMTRKEFYSTECLEFRLNEYFIDWITSYDGFGTWFDGESDRIHIDPIHVFMLKDSAIREAQRYNEKCIYDAEHKRIIKIGFAQAAG